MVTTIVLIASIHTIAWIKHDRSKYDFYRGTDYVKKFCADLRMYGTKTINCKKKEMLPLIDKENKSNKNQKSNYICKMKFYNVNDSVMVEMMTARKIYIDAAWLDDIDNYCDHDVNDSDDEFDTKMFHGDVEGLDNVDDDNNDEELDVIKVHSDVVGLDSNDDYYDCDNGDDNANESDARKFSGNTARLYDVDDYCDHDDDSDDEFGDVKKRFDTSN